MSNHLGKDLEDLFRYRLIIDSNKVLGLRIDFESLVEA